MDHMCHSFDFVAAGTDKWLHDGWSHSRFAGHRHRRSTGPGYSGAKTLVAPSGPLPEKMRHLKRGP